MTKSLFFPKDELTHPAVIEWWYFNGNLRDESQKQYAYMYCLFKADPQRVKLPFLEKVPFKNFYFSHYVFSDISTQKTHSGIHFYSEEPVDKNFFKDGPSHYKLHAENLDLKFIAKKPPLLINETGWVDLKTKDTYYYSFTNLETRGKITLENKEILVSGKSWLDHQWADKPYSSEDKWRWFSLQLDNHAEILCFEYGDKHKTKLASISYPDGKQATTDGVSFKSLGKKWTSPRTRATYDLEWEIEIPKWGVRVKARPKLLEQEVIFGTINSWEGGLKVGGEFNGQKVFGEGFLELVGVPMGRSIAETYLDHAKKIVSDYLARP